MLRWNCYSSSIYANYFNIRKLNEFPNKKITRSHETLEINNNGNDWKIENEIYNWSEERFPINLRSSWNDSSLNNIHWENRMTDSGPVLS